MRELTMDTYGHASGLVFALLVAGPLGWVLYWAWACHFLAVEKERTEVGWMVARIFLGPLAFLPLAFAPDLSEYDEGSAQVSPGTRLRELAELHQGGLITVEEFEARRARILEDL